MAAHSFRPTSFLPFAIKNILIANGLFFLLQGIFPGVVEHWFALWPIQVPEYLVLNKGYNHFYLWQIISYGFLHGSMMHIFFNMLCLVMFGRELEQEWGAQRFLVFYMLCVLGAAATNLAYSASVHSYYPTLGASGGTFGILLAYGMRFPNREIMLLFPPIPMKARTFVIMYGTMELFLGASRMPGDNIAHFAHLGGLLTGIIILMYWRGQLPLKPKNKLWW